MTPLVSVLTPAYNVAKYLGDTVRSVLAQTYPQVEMIIVNDGSKDDTLAVAKSFTDPRVKVVDQDNRGQSASENRAFRECQGEFVIHLDADDLISADKIAVQVARLQEAEPGCVAFHPWGRFYTDPKETKLVPEPFWRDIAPIDFHVEMWERHSMVQGACYLLPRNLIEAAGPWNESLSLINDFDFFPRVLLRATSLLFCPEPLLHYRSGLSNALSGSKSPAAWLSASSALASGTNELLAQENSLRTRRACSRAFEEFVYASYPDVPHLRKQAWDRVCELGGPYFEPQMGPKMKAVSRIIGWRLAARLRSVISRLGSRG